MLFTSPTCPNCKMAKMMLDKDQVQYQNIEISSDENKQKAVNFGITKAPTLLVPNGTSYDVYDNASLIRGYLDKVKSSHNVQ